MAIVLVVATAVPGAGPAAQPIKTAPIPDSHPVHEMVAAERAFAAMSLERGMKDAFLEWLADESIMFRPLAVDGKAMWNSRPHNPATLAWEPSYAEIAGSGELGVTTGPWEFRPGPDSAGVVPGPDQYGHGQFLTMWRKQTDGRWRVVVDIGINHGRPDPAAVGSGRLTLGPDHAWATKARAPRARTDLAAVDRLWAASARKAGVRAYGTWATEDLRLLREGEHPVVGRAAAQATLSATADLLDVLPAGSGTSISDDLGYTYGVVRRRAAKGTAPDSSAYVNVWRKGPDRKWRIALAVENPLQRSR